ncbi:MAG: hypothetical protein M3O28_11645, partial [Actinomycetota bacterium]|nr:hypothetical protein [Actinomycetota bacterium]
AIGNRVGLMVNAAQEMVAKIGRDAHHAIAGFTLAGGDPSSAAGLSAVAAFDKATVQGLHSQVGVLNTALATAKRYGDKATIKDVTDRLNTALTALDDAMVTSLTDWRAAVEKNAQEAVDASSQALALAQGGQQILSLQQQLAGTDQTPGGGQQIAAYITTTIIPALQKQFEAQKADQAAAGSVGDQARVNQDLLAEQQSQTQILQASLDAQKAIKDTSQQSAAALRQFGGSLAFQAHGQGITDLASFGVGT